MRIFDGRLLLALFLWPSTALWASPGQSGGVLFREPFGARPFAMGQAYAALGDDVFGMFYNPASLSRLKQSQMAVEFVRSIADVQLGYIGLASALNPSRSEERRVGKEGRSRGA